MTRPIFELAGVHVTFPAIHALQNVSLSINPGERVALIGPSGAGKSTLLAVMNGSLRPSAGRVRLIDHDIHKLEARQRRQVLRQIGMIHQQLHLVGNLSVVHNVNAGKLGRWSLLKAAWSLFRPLESDDVNRALDAVGIAEKLHARTDTLSGGQQQRVAIARVLVQNPAAILADEPISSIDPERGREVMDLLRDLCVRLNTALIVSLHSLEFVQSHVTRIVGLREGRIAFDLPAAQVTPAITAALYQIARP